MRVAVIGAGISGIAFAGVMQRFGHHCVIYEKGESVGGIWALAYPEVRLQNSYEQYAFIDFPWPVKPDQHPTGAQIREYLAAAVTHYALDVRLRHEVVRLEEADDGWIVHTAHDGEPAAERYDYVVASIGQYALQKLRPEFPGEAQFRGEVITERDVHDLECFRGRRVAVVGFGKSAVDMATLAAPLAASVTHVFRTPRWLVPFRVAGMHFTYPFFCRATTVFMPSWVHAGRVERSLHGRFGGLVRGFWRVIETVVTRHIRGHSGGDAGAAARLAAVTPRHGFVPDMRSATAMAPPTYYGRIASGNIVPRQGQVRGFTPTALELEDGSEVEAELVVLAVGSGPPVFPFLPPPYRALLEGEPDGVQLYRHILHPQIPRFAFAGYNHGFMHVPAAELAAVWLCAVLRGDLKLPEAAAQERSILAMREWKREHIHFEPSRSCAVSTRFQQHIDTLLKDLGVSPYRKMPNIFAEALQRYGASDYAGIVQDVIDHPAPKPRAVQALDA